MERSDSYSNAVAIIGMAGHFPGARHIEAFWDNLRNGVESIAFFTDAELRAAGVDSATLNNPHYVKAHAVLDDIELFDAEFFGYSPREAEIIDPQQRLFLEEAWHALEHAGYAPTMYEGHIGLFAGASMSSYLLYHLIPNKSLIGSPSIFQLMLGNDKDFLPSRVAYKLNLKGPSIAVQTACSTSLVAVALAYQSVLSGECDMALAGGVSIKLPQRVGYWHQTDGIASPDGHCRAFDAKAQGTVGGNGVGVVVLKRLEDALHDGDTIHAIIRGGAVNNDGAVKMGYTAPGIEGQAEVIADALAMAGVRASEVTYIETHGTGTQLGDPIEVAALTRVFQSQTDKKQFCALGSLKTNIGHLDAAAGVASLIKTVLALEHGQIPPSLHFEQPNSKIDFAQSPFYINTTLTSWQTNEGPRIAGVSSFGIGGTNAHVALEEAPAVQPSSPGRSWHLLILSARTPSSLEIATAQLIAHLKEHPHLDFADVAYTYQVGRKALAHRRILVCQDSHDACEALERHDPQRVSTRVSEARPFPVIFMFPGQGTQYVHMARELYQSEEVFRTEVNYCIERLQTHLQLDLRPILYPVDQTTEDPPPDLNQTWLAQPALFVVEYALAKLWLSWGISPQAMIGHSIGEYVAACLAEVFSLDDALMLIAWRGRLMQKMPRGAMLAVALAEQPLQSLLTPPLELAAVNAPHSCVVSGPTQDIEAFERTLRERNIACQRLHTSHAFHSSMTESIMDEFTRIVRGVPMRRPTVPYISNLTGSWTTEQDVVDPTYWSRHLRHTVRFGDGIAMLTRETPALLIEVGPGRTLSTLARHYEQAIPLTSLRHPQQQGSDVASMLTTLGQLWLHGVPLHWSSLYTQQRRRRLPLPVYPFERQRYWIEEQSPKQKETATPDGSATGSPEQTEAPMLYQRLAQSTPYIAPATETEQKLVSIWQEVLGIAQVSTRDSFFDLGGDSLQILQMNARIRETFPVEVTLHDLLLLQSHSIVHMAELIDQKMRARTINQ